MQTFLPFPNYYDSAIVLDNKRLGKQRVEALQIYRALTEPDYGWQHHPAVRMWEGYERSLCLYGFFVCNQWEVRGFTDNLGLKFFEISSQDLAGQDLSKPPWIGGPIHASHRSNLLRKYPEHYGQFGWEEPNDLPYYWPTKEMEKKE